MTRTCEQNIADYVAEIARDHWTLNNVPDPAPSAEFYIQRIQMFQEEVAKLKKGR